MKKFLALALALIMVLSLAACGECKHETWNSPDCVTPATCAKCGITEGEALGHSFAEASCTAPETCYLCGETQGEALPHTYGTWELGSSDMSRVCSECSYTDTQPIDHEVALKSALAGRWDFLKIEVENKTIDTYSGYPGNYIDFNADGSGTFYTPILDTSTLEMEEVLVTDFTISDFEYDSELDCYNFTMTDVEGGLIVGQYRVSDNGTPLLMTMLDAQTIPFFTKNTHENAALTGTWTSPHDGSLFVLNLLPDGNLTGDINGEVTGTWAAMPIILSNGTWYTGIRLQFQQDGVWAYTDYLSWLGYESDDPKQCLEQGYFSTFSIPFDDDWCYFSKLTEEEFEALKVAHEEGRDLVVGTWSTDVASWYDSNIGEEVDTEGEYSLVFNADGTLSANLLDTLEGSWSYRGAEMNGMDINFIIDYVLGEDESYFRILGDGSLLAPSMLATDGKYYSYSMDKN